MLHKPRCRSSRERPRRSVLSDALSRRQFLAISAGAVTALMNAGCGSGSTDTGGPRLAFPPRPTPTGAFSDQIEQFSQVHDKLSLTFSGKSEGVDALNTWLSGGSSRAAGVGAPISQMVEAAWYGLHAAREVYERSANMMLNLDDTAYLGDIITSKNALTGAGALSNPQFISAMMERSFNNLQLMGGFMTALQRAGLQHFIALVDAQADPTNRLVAYAILADVYNTWVAGLCVNAQCAVDSAWLLDVSAAITADNVAVQLNRIASILPELPHGPGYRAPVVGSRSAGVVATTVSAAENFVPGFLGAFSQNYLEKADPGIKTPATILDALKNVPNEAKNSAAKARMGIAFSKSAFMAPILAGHGPGFTNPQTIGINLLVAALGDDPPETPHHVVKSIAKCTVAIAAGVIQTTADAVAAVVTSETILGAVAFGSLAAFSMKQTLDTTKGCMDELAQQLEKAANAADADRTIPGVKSVRTYTDPSTAECDQLAASGVRQSFLSSRRQSPSIPSLYADATAEAARKIVCGALTGATREVGSVPRTFINVENGAIALLYDHAQRNPHTVQGQIDNKSRITFYRTNFAALIRRNPGATSMEVPLLSAADLLCTMPGYVPSRNGAPMDFNKVDAIPPLKKNAGVGTGVDVSVH